ncbi:MAG: DnaD domain protein [Dehalococcoidia bacterium]
MKPFDGFQKNTRYTPLPNVFFSRIAPDVQDAAELKVILHIFYLLYQKKGYPKYVADAELLSDKELVSGVGGSEALHRGLRQALDRGVLVRCELERGGQPVALYLLNSEEGREACSMIKNGEIDVAAVPVREACGEVVAEPNIFELYERNIGMLTPMIGDELKEAEQIYPASWIEDAFREAVSRNKRSWKYIETILKRWASEGRGDGETGRDSKEDPDRYVKGKYGHIVKR